MSKTARALILAVPLVSLSFMAAPAGASGDKQDRQPPLEVEAELHPVPGTGIKGGGEAEVEFTRSGQIDEFDVQARGLLADAPHAAHIHFGEQARHECPTLADDTSGDGRLSTLEGAPAYGPVVVSLTKSGDTSPASVLAIDRFDFATDGTIDYEREGILEVEDGVAEAIAAGKAVVVIHGVDYNDNGKYDFHAGRSELDRTLPAEATNPALCGVLENED